MNKDLRMRLAKCYVWSVTMYGAKTWTLREEDELKLEAHEVQIQIKMTAVS